MTDKYNERHVPPHFLPASLFLDEISKATGIPAEELKKMDMHDIEDKLNLRDKGRNTGESLYKFVSRHEYEKRQKVVDKELEKFQKSQDKPAGD